MALIGTAVSPDHGHPSVVTAHVKFAKEQEAWNPMRSKLESPIDWDDPKNAELRKRSLSVAPLTRLAKDLRKSVEREIQRESLRPIRFIRDGHQIDINYGTRITIPTWRPYMYTNEVYKMMELMNLIPAANSPSGRMLCAQEQIDWIKIAGKTGFKKP